MKKFKLHRIGSSARKIQDWLLNLQPQERMINSESEWYWLPMNCGLCIGLEWQGGFEKNDPEYGKYIRGGNVICGVVKFTDDFIINGPSALYAGACFDECLDYSSDVVFCKECDSDGFYDCAKQLAQEYAEMVRHINLNHERYD